jgi:hypothetical protein
VPVPDLSQLRFVIAASVAEHNIVSRVFSVFGATPRLLGDVHALHIWAVVAVAAQPKLRAGLAVDVAAGPCLLIVLIQHEFVDTMTRRGRRSTLPWRDQTLPSSVSGSSGWFFETPRQA